MGMSDAAQSADPTSRFSRRELLVIAACAISMLIVQMDWFALNLALPVDRAPLRRAVDRPAMGGQRLHDFDRRADGHGRAACPTSSGAARSSSSGLARCSGSSPPSAAFRRTRSGSSSARVVHGVGAALIFPVVDRRRCRARSPARGRARAIGVVLGFACDRHGARAVLSAARFPNT